MLKSYNGWPVIPKGNDDRLAIIPKVVGRVLKGDVEFLFIDLVKQFDKYVEDVDLGEDDWGYANKLVYDSDKISCHASGTAIDLNATRHPIGRRGTFSAPQLKNLEKILKRYSGVIVWGGVWDRADDMHFEISGSPEKVKNAVAKLKKTIAAETAPVRPKNYEMNVRIQRNLRKLELYFGAIDGVDGKVQRAAVKKYQAAQRAPFKLVADGVWGPTTEKHYQWVIKLQNAMNKFGKVSSSRLYVDGDYGIVTVRKVKTLQTLNRGRRYRGRVDSVPGPMFCKMIGIPTHP